MTKTNRFLICVAGILLVCLLAVGTVSAYDPDTACTSLKEVIAGSGDLTAIELVYDYSDGSVGYIKIWTDNCPNAREETILDLQDTLSSSEKERRDISRIVFTAVTEEKRTSYELSQEKSVFVMLPEAVKFPVDVPEIEMSENDADKSGTLQRDDYGPFHDFDLALNGGFYTQSAWSYTDPETYIPWMTVDTYILKKVGLHWETSHFEGDTENNVKELFVSDGPFTLSSGTYKQKAHFSGVRVDYSQYSEDRYGTQFTV